MNSEMFFKALNYTPIPNKKKKKLVVEYFKKHMMFIDLNGYILKAEYSNQKLNNITF